jgi:hypothetical protein
MPTPKPGGLYVEWTWCAQCQRADVLGSYRLIYFIANTLHRNPAMLRLCPYSDCGANVNHDGWRWATLRFEHPEYPVTPQRNVVYQR